MECGASDRDSLAHGGIGYPRPRPRISISDLCRRLFLVYGIPL